MRRASYIKFAFTYFPDEDEDIYTYGNNMIETLDLKYIIIGEEYAPTTGKRHFQGYFELKKKSRLTSIKNKLNQNTLHLEHANGNKKQNSDYCKKENSPNFPQKVIFEYPKTEEEDHEKKGFVKSDRKKNEYKLFLNDLKTRSLAYIEEEYPSRYFLQFNQIQRYRLEKEQGSETWNGQLGDKNFWVWGKTGTGKSTWARRQLSNGNGRNLEIYFKPQNKWWDGYISQRVVLIEDWNAGDNGSYSKALLQYLKVWADRFTFNAEVKGGTRSVFPGRYFLIVTCNHSIEDSFSGCDSEDVSALQRRFKEIEIRSLEDIFLSSDLNASLLSKPLYE